MSASVITNAMNLKHKYVYTLKKILKIIELKKVRFMKMNELKLTQVELFSFFHFKCVDAYVSE